MKRLRSSCTILGAIAICICISLFGIKVSANTITEEMDVQTYKPKSISNEQPGMLFENYLESLDEEGNAPRVKKTAGNKLTGIDKAIYTKLSQYISQVAAGDRASTVFDIPVKELGLEQLSWTASELGVEAIIVGEAFSDDAIAAVRAKCTYHSSQIIQALLADNPYGLYWYEKTKNTSTKGYQISSDYDIDKDEYIIKITGSISMSFPVAEEYSAGEYTFDTTIGKSVQYIVENATAIVAKYAAATDYKKLQGYRQEICDRVSYNTAAASGGVSYGNPWQLIWVFDDDSSTNVVCEGYSKAFQYLCNLTDFTDEIDCICVSGTMQGGTGAGPHMWNIVTMDDRKNYLVDVTNCDSGTIGADTQLFLVGYSSKESDTQYTFKCNSGNIIYVYNEKTTALYSEELEIHNTKYGVHTFGEWTVTKAATCTEAGSRERTCSDCGTKVTEEIPALGHSWSENYIVDKQATCAEEGSESIHCSVCGAIKEGSSRAIEKKEHTYGDWTVTKESTCTQEGSKEKVCSVCKDKVTATIPVIDHSWDEGKVTLDPTGNKPGIKTFTCSVCGTTKTEDILATGTHTYVGTVTKEATCTETGIMTYTCTDEDCTASYTEPIPATGHHIEAAPVTENEIPATYLADGSFDSVIYCIFCGKELYRENIIIPKLTAKDQTITVAKTSYNFIFSSSKIQSQAVSVSGAKGKLSYTSSKSSYVYIKDGKIYVTRSAPAGNYTISIRAAGTEDGEYNASNTVTVKVKVAKAANTIKVTPVTKKFKVAKVKKKAQSFQLKVTQAQGKITYKSSSSKVKVTATGKVTVKKGTKKGKYRITVTANGNENYNKGVKTVVITVK